MMMDRILLGVLYLSGWFMFCHLRQYHYVPDLKNWTEAQSYCRNNYTDLATIENTEEMNQLLNISSANRNIWTGLYGKINWTWSDGYTDIGYYYRLYFRSYFGQRWCLSIDQSGLWYLDNCSTEYTFICYNGTQQNPEFVFVNEPVSWSRAQSYCRENFTDLVTVRNSNGSFNIQSLVPSGNQTWIGLNGYYDVYWSDSSNIKNNIWKYFYWIYPTIPITCGSVYTSSPKSKTFIPCDYKLPFFCYSITPVRKQVVKLKFSSSVDLNDDAVKADILKMIQDRLQEKGMSGVTLKWREQPDGKVFHKEEQTIVTSDGC